MTPSKNTNKTLIISIAAVAVVGLIGGSIVLSQLIRNAYFKPNHSNMNDYDKIISMLVNDSVKDDQTFIEQMIPHHQEAIDTSNIILLNSDSDEIKQFARGVIDAQVKENEEMKSWHEEWFGKDYTANSELTMIMMMGDLTKLSGSDLDQAYAKGMVMHHKSAIEMAKKIKTISTKTEVLNLADDVILSQSTEVNALQNWLMSKYKDHRAMAM